EGASDTLALGALHLAAIGRPSCRGGLDPLAELLRDFTPDRAILVVGEHDARITPQGLLWPGRDGARDLAGELSQRLGRAVSWTLPPIGSKDVRAWVLAHPPGEEDSAWTESGVRLSELLVREARLPQASNRGEAPLRLMPAEPETPFPLGV